MKFLIEESVLRQALEALDVTTNPRKLQREAIAALRSALDAAEKATYEESKANCLRTAHGGID